MSKSRLGRTYSAGAVVFRQGEHGDCMYLIQEGQIEVVMEQAGQCTRVAVRGTGEFFGEMAIFEREVRMATVRALGPARILTIDRRNLLRSIHEDPSLAFHMIEALSGRVRALSQEVARLRAGGAAPEAQTESCTTAERPVAGPS